MALLNFKYGAQSGLSNQGFSAGTVYVTSDTKKLFVDNPNGTSGRICLGDFQLVNWTKSDAVTSPATALSNYSLKDTNTLYITVANDGATAMWRYNGTSFVAISNSEEIADIVADIAAINTALNGKAPTNHAVNASTYGLGTSGAYGHVKLTDATNTTQANGQASKGIAASAYAVKLAYDRGSLGVTNAATAQSAAEAADAKAVAAQGTADAAVTAAEKAQGEVDALELVVDGKAPIDHASTATTYGAGSSTEYGHVKLSDATNVTSANGGAATGVAASAYAVKLAYDRGSKGVTDAAAAANAASAASTAAQNAQSKADEAYTLAGTKTTTAAVKTQIEAYGYATTGVAQGYANTAESNANDYTDEQIADVNTAIDDLKDDIGNLSNIMNFLGVTSSPIDTNTTMTKIDINDEEVTVHIGDVVIKGNSEYVYDGTEWNEIGNVDAVAAAVTTLQNTVGTKPSTPTMDNTLWEEVADLRSDLGESGDAATKTTTAFGRIKALEEWKSTHTTAFNNLSTTVSGNTTAINNLTTVLTWGTF